MNRQNRGEEKSYPGRIGKTTANPLTNWMEQCNMAVVIATINALVAEWYTQQVEGLCSKGRAGSSPVEGTSEQI